MKMLQLVCAIWIAIAAYFPHETSALDLEIRDGSKPVVWYSVADLEAMPVHEIQTETPWTEGKVTFSGPLLRDVLKRAGFQHSTFQAVALNDYLANIPITDPENLDVIIATRINGKQLSIRDRGPFWIMYPLDTLKFVNMLKIKSRCVWQLKSILKP